MPDTERRTVRVEVFTGAEGGDDWPTLDDGTPVYDLIGWLQRKVEEIPEKHRPDMKCTIDTQPVDYDDYRARIDIWYDRPETDEEYERRTTQDARHKERVREIQARAANTRDRRGEAKEIVRGLGPGLEAMRKKGLTE